MRSLLFTGLVACLGLLLSTSCSSQRFGDSATGQATKSASATFTTYFSDAVNGASWSRWTANNAGGSKQWTLNPSIYFSSPDSFTIGGNYWNGENDTLTTTNSFSVPANRQGLRFKFYTRFNIAAGDHGFVEYSKDGGANWIQVADLTGSNASYPNWDVRSYAIPAPGSNANVKLRFHFTSNASGTAWGWGVDTVSFYQTNISTPNNVSASDGTIADTVHVDWGMPSDGGTVPSKFYVYRSNTQNGTYSYIGPVDYPTMEYDDAPGDLGVHWYKVRGYRAGYDYGPLSIATDGYAGWSEWNHSWGSPGIDRGTSVTADSAGNVYALAFSEVNGGSDQDALVLKYNAAGTLQWARTWGGASPESAGALAVDGSGNVYATLTTQSYGTGGWCAVVLKYAGDGTLAWQKKWDKTGSIELFLAAAIDGNALYLAGDMWNGTAYDAVLVKVDTGSGTMSWDRAWGGSVDESTEAVSVDSLGNVFTTGQSDSYGVGGGAFILKYGADGTLARQTLYDQAGTDNSRAVVHDSSDNLFICGSNTNSGPFLVKIDSSGNLVWQTRVVEFDLMYALAVNSDDVLYAAGSTSGNDAALLSSFLSDGSLDQIRMFNGPADDSFAGVFFPGAGPIRLAGYCGSANGGSWSTPSPITQSNPSGALSDPEVTGTTPAGTFGDLTGGQNTPTGTQDSGAGSADVLVCQHSPL